MPNEKVNYLNWVPIKLIYLLLALLIVSIFLVISSFMKVSVFYSCQGPILWLGRIIGIIFLVVFSYLLILFLNARYAFSYTGGKVSDKILEYVLTYLKYDGRGKLLDIGCGSGALSIKCAKKYPQCQIIGVDYWGSSWDYNKKQCEVNAKAEEVLNVHFEKGDASSLTFKSETLDAAVSNFVFHEVKNVSDKRLVIKEALRVLKKGSPFAFHDLFFNENYYGKEQELRNFLENLGLKKVTLKRTEDLEFIPRSLVKTGLLKGIGLIYGIK